MFAYDVMMSDAHDVPVSMIPPDGNSHYISLHANHGPLCELGCVLHQDQVTICDNIQKCAGTDTDQLGGIQILTCNGGYRNTDKEQSISYNVLAH